MEHNTQNEAIEKIINLQNKIIDLEHAKVEIQIKYKSERKLKNQKIMHHKRAIFKINNWLSKQTKN